MSEVCSGSQLTHSAAACVLLLSTRMHTASHGTWRVSDEEEEEEEKGEKGEETMPRLQESGGELD